PIGSDPVASGPFQGQELPRPDDLPFFESWDSYFGEGIGDSNFLFDNGNVQAFVARNEIDHSVAIAFRGSEGISDLIQDLYHGVTTFSPEYNQFHYLVESLQKYITANNITKVLVTGHSLGAVMAEFFMKENADSSTTHYVGVTFGSPSDRSLNGIN